MILLITNSTTDTDQLIHVIWTIASRSTFWLSVLSWAIIGQWERLGAIEVRGPSEARSVGLGVPNYAASSLSGLLALQWLTRGNNQDTLSLAGGKAQHFHGSHLSGFSASEPHVV